MINSLKFQKPRELKRNILLSPDKKILYFSIPKETLGNPSDPRDNSSVITGQDWIDGRQAARLLGLRADHGQEADQTGEVSL